MAKDILLHASSVAYRNRGLLILGVSGSGKSTLAFQLMALGATLVSDDQTLVTPALEGPPRLSAPAVLAGLIEARGIGLVRVPHTTAFATLAVTLDDMETQRMPPIRHTVIADTEIPLLRKVESPAFPSILWHCLIGERIEP